MYIKNKIEINRIKMIQIDTSQSNVPLSNNYQYPITIEGEEYNTITHYVLCQLLNNIPLRTEINQCVIGKIQEKWKQFKSDEERQYIYDCLFDVLQYKLNTDEELKKILLQTKQKNIKYITDEDDVFWGCKDNKGENFYGNVLTKVRFKLEQELKDNNIFLLYFCEKNMEREMDNGNILTEYEKDTLEDIYDKFKHCSFPITRQKVKELYKKKLYEPLAWNVKDMIKQLRIKNIGKCNKINKELRSTKVVMLYIEYIIRKLYPDISDDGVKVKRLQDLVLNNFTDGQLYKLKKRCFRLFENGFLSNSLSDKIDDIISVIPKHWDEDESEDEGEDEDNIEKETKDNTEKETKDNTEKETKDNTEKETKDNTEKDEKDIGNDNIENEVEDDEKIVEETEEDIYIYDEPKLGVIYNKLSLNHINPFDVKINNDNVVMFSILYHLCFKMLHLLVIKIENDLDGNIKSSIYSTVKQLLTSPPENISDDNYKEGIELLSLYMQLLSEYNYSMIEKHLVIGLNKKFESKEMKDILDSTGNQDIHYDSDIGVKVKNNFIGNHLIKLRTMNKSNSVLEKNKTLPNDIDKWITNQLSDELVKQWFIMRWKDFNSIIKIIENRIGVTLSGDKLRKTLDIIFNTVEGENMNKKPSDICTIISNDNEEQCTEIWRRTSVPLYYIYNNYGKDESVLNILVQNENSNRKGKTSLETKEIFLALMSILEKVKIVNKIYECVDDIDTDIKTSTDILLGRQCNKFREYTDEQEYNELDDSWIKIHIGDIGHHSDRTIIEFKHAVKNIYYSCVDDKIKLNRVMFFK